MRHGDGVVVWCWPDITCPTSSLGIAIVVVLLV
jgi:hypothetical protein